LPDGPKFCIKLDCSRKLFLLNKLVSLKNYTPVSYKAVKTMKKKFELKSFQQRTGNIIARKNAGDILPHAVPSGFAKLPPRRGLKYFRIWF
jgi:hypothetical protein